MGGQAISAHVLIYSSYAMWGIIEDLNIVILPSHFHQHLCSLPSCVCDLNQFWLFCLGRFALLLSTTFKLFVFLFERTGWRFFHKLIVRAKFDIYICIRNQALENNSIKWKKPENITLSKQLQNLTENVTETGPKLKKTLAHV